MIRNVFLHINDISTIIYPKEVPKEGNEQLIVKALASQEAIISIHYWYSFRSVAVEGVIDGIEALTGLPYQFLNSWKVEREVSLLEVIQELLEKEDLTSSSVRYLPEDTSSDEGTIVRKQDVIDVLVGSVAAYLSILDLLLQQEFTDSLPFQFSLPYTKVSASLLSQSMFCYLEHPVATMTRFHADGLFPFLIEFVNVWGHLFIEGSTFGGRNNVMMEVVNGYFNCITESVTASLEKASQTLRDRAKEETAKAVAAGIEDRVQQACEVVAGRNMALEQRISILEMRLAEVIETINRVIKRR